MKKQHVEFVVIGTVVFDEETGRKRVAINSEPHLRASIQRLSVGDEVVVTYSTRKLSRSDGQLRYHWALMGYLADYTGHSAEEMHEFVMRSKFGTKRIAVGDQIEEVRRSIASGARMSWGDMMELIEYDLELLAGLGIVVPSREELGYAPVI
jgi:hypothetical protein